MQPLSFVCPTTKQRAVTEIYADWDTFASARYLAVRCPLCSETHEIACTELPAGRPASKIALKQVNASAT